jgi:uncharacterized membrane protein
MATEPSTTPSTPAPSSPAQPPAAPPAGRPAPSKVYSVLLFAFDGAKTAGGLVDQVIAAQRQAGLKLVAQAVVEREADGNVHVREPGRGGVGATAGAVTGGLLALLGGPVGVLTMIVAGGVIGGVAGHFAGRVLPADELRKVGQSLPLNSSGFIVITEDREAEKAIDAMKQYTANVVVITAGSELSGMIGQVVAGDVQELPQAQASAQPSQSQAAPRTGAAADAPKAQGG